MLLSINRFERKKNILLAIESFARLCARHPADPSLQLVVAGGYDTRVAENVEYHRELCTAADAHGLTHVTASRDAPAPSATAVNAARVVFVLSFTEAQRSRLMQLASVLIYTPDNEVRGRCIYDVVNIFGSILVLCQWKRCTAACRSSRLTAAGRGRASCTARRGCSCRAPLRRSRTGSMTSALGNSPT